MIAYKAYSIHFKPLDFGGTLQILQPISLDVQSPLCGDKISGFFNTSSRFLRIYMLSHLKLRTISFTTVITQGFFQVRFGGQCKTDQYFPKKCLKIPNLKFLSESEPSSSNTCSRFVSLQCSKLRLNWSHMRLQSWFCDWNLKKLAKLQRKEKLATMSVFVLFRSVQLCLVPLLFRKFSYFYHIYLQSCVIGKSPILPESISLSRCQNGFEANAGWFRRLGR